MRTRIIVAVGLVVVGLVWIGQGTGLLVGTGFMVGDARWAAVGVTMVAVGVVLGLSALRGRPRA
ncbi:MAG: hypothetical protein ACSLFN_03885 [Candidatus Limnocylindrales bacterium]